MEIQSQSTRKEIHVEKESRRTSSFAAMFTVAAGSGVPLGVALHNLPLGIALGTFFGLAVGIALHIARIRGRARSEETPGKM
jgi:multidrug transporter EmrE-like cation transporter